MDSIAPAPAALCPLPRAAGVSFSTSSSPRNNDFAPEPTKRCPDCGEVKGVSEFYAVRVRGKVRPTAYCRLCERARVVRYQATLTPEEKAARDAAAHRRYQERHPERVPTAAVSFDAWEAKNPERAAVLARTRPIIERALRAGILTRPEACEACAKTGVRIEAAHGDYARPLEVRWLCRSCHIRWDRREPKTLKALAA